MIMLDNIGICCLCFSLFAFIRAANAEIFSIFNEKESNQINSHNTKKLKSLPHDSFDLAFPLFNELFPLSGLDSKPKELFNRNNLKEEKDIFLDLSDNQELPQTDDKGKRKTGKDKLIMSFTELFIPFQKHKSQYDFSNVRKNDFFDDIFNNFPFVDMDGGLFDKLDKQSTKKRRFPKRKYEKNIIRSTNGTNTVNLFEIEEKNATPKHSLLNRFDSKIPDSFTLFSKYNDSDGLCCGDHEECHKGAHCTSKTCKSNLKNSEITNKNNENNIKKSLLLDKTFLICAIPGLIGFGALIFGIEVLRRHNELVKQTPFLSQYNQVQSC